jgi:hypothetical protein
MKKKAQVIDIFFLRMAEDIAKFYLTYYADYPYRILGFHLQLLEELYSKDIFNGLKGFELRQAKEIFLVDLQNKVNDLSYIYV